MRIQVTTRAHPELDGGWLRAFDYRKWDYWGSNTDADWGAWSTVSTSGGIFPPRRVEFSVSEDARQFRTLRTAEPGIPSQPTGPLAGNASADGLKARGR